MEILQNTIMKLVVRQGTDLDRKRVVLNSGELGYTTDSERLYVGNGALSGGNVVGNLFLGSNTDITTLSPGVIGDLGFNPDNNRLYRVKYNDGSNINDWELIGGVPNHLYAMYNGSLSSLEYSSRVTSVDYLSTGHYRFRYSPINSYNLIPNAQIFGYDAVGYEARTVSISNSACEIKIINNIPDYVLAIDGVTITPTIDATIILSITY